MIRHILLLNWVDPLDAAKIDDAVRIVESVRTLPWIAGLYHGSGLKLAADGYDFVVVMDFASEDDWRAYDGDPQHKAAADALRPLVSAKARIQFEVPQ
jgi:hypothetical protein